VPKRDAKRSKQEGSGHFPGSNTISTSSSDDGQKKKKEFIPNKPFSRIEYDKIHYADERVKDNTFEALQLPENHYTVRAHQDLIVTKGKGFTKEKNKKKRGSYRGGAIDFSTNSFKFND
jgi:hypothetical protein